MNRSQPPVLFIAPPVISLILLMIIPSGCQPPSSAGGGSGGDSGGMEFVSEGSIDNPIVIPPNTGYSGQVGTTRSYYKTYGVTGESVYVYLTSLSDDADLIDFEGDEAFGNDVNDPAPDTEDPRAPPVGYDRPYFGRTMAERIWMAGPAAEMYFVVDGSHTQGGTAYTLTIDNPLGGGRLEFPQPTDQGTAESPWLLLAGLRDSTRSVATFSYYRVSVAPGATYWVNTFGDVTAQVYIDQFITEVGSPVTPSSDTLYIKVAGNVVTFAIEVVTDDGSLGVPLSLYVGKTNWNQVGASSSSYYIFEVSSGASYSVNASWLSNNVDLFVFDSGNFTNLFDSAETGDDPEICSVTPTGNYITVRVDDISGNGATFLLKVVQE